jgi:hypothetical protein
MGLDTGLDTGQGFVLLKASLVRTSLLHSHVSI